MSDEFNPLRPAIHAFLDKINLANWTLFVLQTNLGKTQKVIAAEIQSNTSSLPAIEASARLLITDLRQPRGGKWPIRAMGRETRACDEQYVWAIEGAIRRNAGWAMSQGYEAFETYMFDVAALYLHDRPAEADAGELKRFRTKKASAAGPANDEEFWRQFTRFAYRGKDNTEMRKLLRCLVMDLATTEACNRRGLDLNLWYGVATEVRHAITHGDFELKPARISNWSHREWELLAAWFGIKQGSRPHLVEMTPDEARRCLTLFAEYGMLIFDLLSKQASYSGAVIPLVSEPTARRS